MPTPPSAPPVSDPCPARITRPPEPDRRRKLVPGGRITAWILGVVLPLCALGVEINTGMAREFLDPVPTWGHACAIALVPIAHGLALLSLGRPRRSAPFRLVAHLNSAAFAIGLVYTILFAPITPFAFVAIIIAGLGLLALSPLFSVLAALCLRTALRRDARETGARLPSFWPGFAAGLLLVVALEAPSFFTRRAVQHLARGSASEQHAALQRLRTLAPFGVETQLLRGCYGRPNGGLFSQDSAAWIGLFEQAPREDSLQTDSRLAYYRVTGRAYNSVPAPRRQAFALVDRPDDDDTNDWIRDDALGIQQVGDRLRALRLAESSLDARLESDAALGYVEWTLVFRNDHAFDQREARALIQLPPGAAVSRLTLWVNGQEREAAWGGPAQVVGAYRSVAVAQRRDPVLVTAQGPDRVLMQCFPVEPRGGLMKVRLGVTLPLALAEAGSAHLLLPRVIGQNFSLADSLAHQLRVEADAPLTSPFPALQAEGSPARLALRGTLSVADFSRGVAPVAIARSPSADLAWSPALRDPSRIVTQTLRRRPPPAGEIALLVSGSAELAPASAALAAALRHAKTTPFARLYHAGDRVAESLDQLDADMQASWLEARPFAGGQDDTDALATALDALAARGGGTLVWIHGGQPLSWQNTSTLEQRLSSRGAAVRIIVMPALAAPNVLLEKVAAVAPISTFPRLADLDTDLARLLRELREGRLLAERAAASSSELAPAGNHASDHLARLWARDEVERLLATRDPAAREAAQKLALSTQIVTPVSGAVVLETDAQYKTADLAAPDAKNSPVVPEPATYGLLMSAATLAFALLRRRRRPSPARIPAAG